MVACEAFHYFLGVKYSLGRPCVGSRAVVHNNHQVSGRQEMSVVRAKYSGLILKESHDAMVEEVSGNMRIHCRQGIVEEIDFFVLSEKFRDVGIFEIKSL